MPFGNKQERVEHLYSHTPHPPAPTPTSFTAPPDFYRLFPADPGGTTGSGVSIFSTHLITLFSQVAYRLADSH